MNQSEESLRELLEQSSRLAGETRISLREDVLRHAEAGGHTRLAFDTRLALVQDYALSAAPARQFAPFARCLAEYDSNPAEYGSDVEHSLLWYFKFAVEGLRRFPEVPLERVRQALDEMRRRYKASEYGPHAVYAYECHFADYMGDTKAADGWYAMWCATPRDEMSDCDGCDPSDKVEHLADRGRDEEAIELAEEALDENLDCVQQPHGLLTGLLLPYLRTGRLAEASYAHRRAYRLQRAKPQHMGYIGDHIEFLARSGNEIRGLELLERHLGWLDQVSRPSDAMWFAASGALLLRRLGETGHKALSIRRPAHGDRPAMSLSVPELGDELTKYALETAVRFDARNGNDNQSRNVQELIDAEPIVDHLELSAVPHQPTVIIEMPALDLADVSPAVLVDRAERHLLLRETWRAKEIVGHLAQQLGADDPRLVSLRAQLTEDEAGLRRAAELFVDDEDRRQVTLGVLGLLLCRTGRGREGMTLLKASAEHLGGHSDQRIAAGLRLAAGLIATNERTKAQYILDNLETGDPLWTGEIAWQRMDLWAKRMRMAERVADVAQEGDLEGQFYSDGENEELFDAVLEAAWTAMAGCRAEMISAAKGAVDAYRAAEAETLASLSAQRLAAALIANSDWDDAETAAANAVSWLPSDAPADLRISALMAQADLLIDRGREAAAVPRLLTALALPGSDSALPARARMRLVTAYFQLDRELDAAETAETAVAAFDRLGDVQSGLEARELLVNSLHELREYDQEVTVHDQLASLYQGRGDHVEAARTLHRAADVLDDAERHVEAAERHRAAGDAAALAGDLQQVASCRYDEVWSHYWADQYTEALAAITVADKAVNQLPDKNVRLANLDYVAALVLQDVERLEEAAGRAARAAELNRSSHRPRNTAKSNLLYGQLLNKLGRPAAAEPVLRAALETYEVHENGESEHKAAARALADALDDLDRADEAEQVRKAAWI